MAWNQIGGRWRINFPMTSKALNRGGRANAGILLFAVLMHWLAGGPANRADADQASSPTVLAIEAVLDDGALRLNDGAALCLAGIRRPESLQTADRGEDWRSAWRDIIEEGAFLHRAGKPGGRDRYGCAYDSIEAADGTSLQHALLAAGWAWVDPSSAADRVTDLDALLMVEDEARRARLGFWREADAHPKKAEELSPWIGTRQLIEGRVRRVSENDRYVYLNFGADWRTDFTVRLDRKLASSFAFDMSDLRGKRLRLRGVLEESRGPLINVSHLKQIEFMP